MDYSHVLDRGESPTQVFVEKREEARNALIRIRDLDYDRLIGRESQDLGRVQATAGSETHQASSYGRASQSEIAGFQDDRFIERFRAKMVILADQDTESLGIFR
jgi:prophage tail gpP-like protein